MFSGYNGRILFVNLTKAEIYEKELDEQVYRLFIGGLGLGVRILYEHMKPKEDPLGPENMIGFLVGPLTGTGIHGARYQLVGKSPLTGGWGDCNSGGRFAASLKASGYDGIFCTGISPKPVYLFVDNGKVEIRNATHLWGNDTVETDNNIVLELEGNEFPILDGSARSVIEAFERVGVKELNAECEYVTPRKALFFCDEKHNRSMSIEPAQYKHGKADHNLYVSYTASFNHPLLGTHSIEACMEKDFLVQEIAPARTFGFLEQWSLLKQQGFALGSSLDNTLVIAEGKFINEPRFPDEWVRHKVLDLIGDLSLIGKCLAGTVRAQQTGHDFHRRVIEHFFQHPQKWKMI